MEKYLQQASKLKKEAEAFLKKSKIIPILLKYGEVSLTGSFAYDLMTWRDIDICLSVKNPTAELLFEIGKKLSKIKGVGSMYFVDEYTKKIKGNPRAMSWHINFGTNEKKWKIDILASTPDIIKKVIEPTEKIISQMTKEKRERILKIKSELTKQKEYRQEIWAVDIYRAVLEDNISTLKEWDAWWNKTKLA